MTIRFWYKGEEKRIVAENPVVIFDYVARLQEEGAHILEIISPPPGKDDRMDGEEVEMVDGVKCYVSTIKFGGKRCREYRFTVPEWSEVKTIGKASVKRMIRGRTAPYVLNTMGKNYGLIH